MAKETRMTQGTIDQAMQLAIQNHQAGRLAEAEKIYRQVLIRQPNHSGALHLLGMIAAQVGQSDVAIELIRRAIAIRPEVAEYHNDLGNALRDKGQLDEATAAYRHALRLKPDYVVAHNNLGHVLRDKGQLDDAIASYRQALRLKPDHARTYKNVGDALCAKESLDEAIAAYREALRLKPDDAETCSNLGNALCAKGLLDEAITAYRQALRLEPGIAETHNNLGNALRDKGQLDEAASAYRDALRLKPDSAKAYSNLGNVLRGKGQLDEAITACRQALRLRPDFAEAHGNLGNALRDKGQLDEATAALHQALHLKPDDAVAHNNLGVVLRDKGLLDEAIAACRQALRLKPDYALAHANLGNALRDQGLLDDAVAAYRQALQLKPDYAEAYSNLGNVLGDKGLLNEAIAAYRQAIALEPDSAAFHSNLVLTLHYHERSDPRMLLAESLQWARQHADLLKQFIPPHTNDRSPGRRLKIGYVSPDFRNHPISCYLLPLLAAHDPAQVEIFCYAQVARPDAITERIRGYAHQWRNIVGMTDAQVAEQINQDRIDILIDLAAHAAGNRLLAFARKPAPVQATYLAYAGTTGLDTIDYRITDPYFDRPDVPDAHYTERSVRLPETLWCYEPVIESRTTPLPAAASGLITFGCLNNFCKITNSTLQVWCGLLAAVPNSRLLLHARIGNHRDRVRQALAGNGLDLHRLEFVDRLPLQQYMEQYHGIDIALDPFPYAGGTTTCDALWMGVPVVTLKGQTAVGRAGFSILMNLGLPELVAHTPPQYAQIAADLAGDLPRLTALRSTLRERMKNSPLMDASRFARNMEAAYRQMWRTWCSSGPQSERS
jgi:protein O-GlcNAc transferase